MANESNTIVAYSPQCAYHEANLAGAGTYLPGHLVQIDSSKEIVFATATGVLAVQALSVLVEDDLIGSDASVAYTAAGQLTKRVKLQSGDRVWLRTTAAAVTVGDLIEGEAATGRVLTRSAGAVLGTALTAGAGAADDMILVEIA